MNQKSIHAWRGSTVSTKVDTHHSNTESRPGSGGKLSKAGWVRLWGCPRHGCRGQAPTDGFTASPATGPIPQPTECPLLLLLRLLLLPLPLRVPGGSPAQAPHPRR